MGTQGERAHFAVGAWVVYGATGVCQVAAVGQLPDLPTAEPGRIYYTLTPVHSREIIYIPADSTIFMRPVISREAAEALLKKIPELDAPVCITRDLRLLRAFYQKFLSTHTCEDLVRLIRSVREKERKLAARGGHTRKIDQDYQRRAEELLCAELSAALCRPYDLVAGEVEQQMAHT